MESQQTGKSRTTYIQWRFINDKLGWSYITKVLLITILLNGVVKKKGGVPIISSLYLGSRALDLYKFASTPLDTRIIKFQCHEADIYARENMKHNLSSPPHHFALIRN